MFMVAISLIICNILFTVFDVWWEITSFLLSQDFNNDGWPELLVTADYGDSKLFWNQKDKTFHECTWDCGLRGEQVSQ